MDKMLNWISVICATIGGAVSQLVGGFDLIFKTLLIMVILDYITGILNAIAVKKLSSEIGFKGIIKKVMIFCVVACSCLVGGLTGDVLPLREAVIIFFAVNEGLSLVENVSEFVPVPKKLKDILLQLREKTSVSKESEGK